MDNRAATPVSASWRHWLSPEATSRCTALARAERLPVEAVLTVAWLEVLARYGECDRLTLRLWGSAGRVVPLVLDWPADRTMRAAAAAVAARCTSLDAADGVANDDDAGWAAVYGGDPRFAAVVLWASSKGESRRDPAAPLIVEFGRDAEAAIDFVYDRRRVDAEVLATVATHVDALLQRAAADADAVLRTQSMLSDRERRQLLEWGSAPHGLEPGEPILHRWWDHIVSRQPNAPAVISADGVVTNADLQRPANALAAQLRARGVGPESPVAVCVDRRSAPVAFWGVLKSGGVYVPASGYAFDGRMPPAIQSMSPAAIVASRDLRAGLDAGGVPVIDVDGASTDADAPLPQIDPDQLAYVLFTSGSTGRPKGVAISHRSLSRYAGGIVDALRLEPSDRVLQFAPLSFDVSIEEYVIAWLSGAAVVIPPDGAVRSVDDLTALIARHGITAVELPTAYWHAWVDWLETESRTLPPTLRLVIIGGEPATAARVDAWQRHRVPLRQVYGLTETTITSTVHEVPAHGSAPSFGLPLGRPLPHAAVRVLDDRLELSPVGVIGEAYVGGGMLARGFLDAPSLTASRFVADPWADCPGGRLYRTGDRMRWRSDGSLEFVGRADRQLKIRGVRIEPGEIESGLRTHPDVADALVLARPHKTGGRRLIAYVITRGGDGRSGDAWGTTSALRRHLRARVPEAFVPAAFVFLDRWPLNAHGKIDRAALPDAAGPRPELDTPYVAPRTPLEQTLCEALGDVLDVRPVGVHDDFFELGGDSLLATQAIARIQQHVSVPVAVRAFFEHPTIAALSDSIVRARVAHADPAEVARALADLDAEPAGAAPAVPR